MHTVTVWRYIAYQFEFQSSSNTSQPIIVPAGGEYISRQFIIGLFDRAEHAVDTLNPLTPLYGPIVINWVKWHEFTDRPSQRSTWWWELSTETNSLNFVAKDFYQTILGNWIYLPWMISKFPLENLTVIQVTITISWMHSSFVRFSPNMVKMFLSTMSSTLVKRIH